MSSSYLTKEVNPIQKRNKYFATISVPVLSLNTLTRTLSDRNTRTTYNIIYGYILSNYQYLLLFLIEAMINTRSVATVN